MVFLQGFSSICYPLCCSLLSLNIVSIIPYICPSFFWLHLWFFFRHIGIISLSLCSLSIWFFILLVSFFVGLSLVAPCTASSLIWLVVADRKLGGGNVAYKHASQATFTFSSSHICCVATVDVATVLLYIFVYMFILIMCTVASHLSMDSSSLRPRFQDTYMYSKHTSVGDLPTSLIYIFQVRVCCPWRSITYTLSSQHSSPTGICCI